MDFLSTVDELKRHQLDTSERLKFSAPILAEYKTWLISKNESIARKVLLIMLFFWSTFWFADFLRLYGQQFEYRNMAMIDIVVSIRTLVLLYLIGLFCWLQRSTVKYKVSYLWIAYFVLATSTAIISNIYHEQGEFQSAWLPIVIVVPLFTLPIGMTFSSAIRLGLSVVTIIGASHFIMLKDLPDHSPNMFLASLFLCMLSGAAGSYYLDKVFKSAFVALKLLELKTFTDPMTDLGNRRYFTSFGNKLVEDAIRTNQSFSLVIIDLDHFKKVNDNEGHEFGDLVLTRFSNLLHKSSRRPFDLPIRLGGEEFAILLKDTKGEDALRLIDTLLIKCKETRYPEAISTKFTISFSAGITEYEQGDDLQAMYKRADKSLYQAKNKGRSLVLLG